MITDSLRYTDTTTIRVQQAGMSLTFTFCRVYVKKFTEEDIYKPQDLLSNPDTLFI